MTTAALRVPRQAQNLATGYFTMVAGPGGTPTNDLNSPAFYFNGKTYVGYVDPTGAIRVVSYTHATGAVAISPQVITGLPANYHCAPAVLVRSSDSKLVVAASDTGSNFYVAISTNAEDVSAWGSPSNIGSTLGGSNYFYPRLFQLSAEAGKIYLLYLSEATNYYAAYSTSTDGGATWGAQTKIYATGNTNLWFFAADSDQASRIDFLASDGAASAGETASIYHFYYQGGSFYKTDGTAISGSMPYAPGNLTKLQDGATYGSIRTPSAIITNGGTPVAVWASYNTAGSGSNENYWYGIYTGGSWAINTIDNTGSVPEIPGCVEGDAVIDRLNPAQVYVSKKVSGRWQMFLYSTANNGSSWTSTQLTFDTTDGGDIKPNAPINSTSSLRCIWESGPYGPQGSLNSISATMQIRGYPNPAGAF